MANFNRIEDEAKAVLNAMINSSEKMLTSADIETILMTSNDKVKEALGWLIESHKVEAVKDPSNKERYALADGTYEKNARTVRRSLITMESQSISELVKTTKLNESDVHGALGWLAGRNDIKFAGIFPTRKYALTNPNRIV